MNNKLFLISLYLKVDLVENLYRSFFENDYYANALNNINENKILINIIFILQNYL